ncbi:MAG: ABC transporter permease [Synechococcales cyanobacterium RM1_1_8]|nr:ABC transporter permease [Synechococcales cyanobacterium RM1_1_8]
MVSRQHSLATTLNQTLLSRHWVQRRDLLTGLVSRNIKLLYNRSVLGIAWMLINPLMQLMVYAFVFGVLLPNNAVPNFTSFIFSGLLVWTWFQSALTEATGAIVQNRALIRQPGFPVSILPVVNVATGLIHFVLSLPILLLFLWKDGVQLQWGLLLLPLLMLLQFAFTVSLAYVLAAINVTFRDTQHTLGVLLQMLFYFSAVFYQVPGQFAAIFNFNPIYLLIQGYRAILLPVDPAVPVADFNWLPLVGLSGITLAMLPLGHRIFQQQSERFVEEL